MEITYREINPDDYKEVYTFNLFHEFSFRDSSPDYTPDDEFQRENKTKRIIETLLMENNRYYCLGAFHGKDMVGMIFQNRMEIDKSLACHIHGLWVHERMRGRGVARELKQRGEDWARGQGCRFMDSNVRVSNSGMRSLNESLGYEVARLNYRKKIQ